MRAQFVLEKFTEEGDPIKDMGIGTITVELNNRFMRKMSMQELKELYKRVHDQDHANVIVDGVPYDALPHYTKVRTNNMAVNAMKYKGAIEKRDEVRSQGLKPGDAIKCQIRGEWWIGYPEFSKRGLIRTDAHGRIVAKTLKGSMKVPLQYAIKLTPKEQKAFDKQYFEKEKDKLEKVMAMYKDIYPTSYKKYKAEYDELIKRFKGKIK